MFRPSRILHLHLKLLFLLQQNIKKKNCLRMSFGLLLYDYDYLIVLIAPCRLNLCCFFPSIRSLCRVKIAK